MPSHCRSLFSARTLLVLLSVLLPATSALCQKITLRRAIEATLSHSGEIIPQADEARSYAAYREARNAYLPRVMFGSGLGGSFGFPLSLENAAPSLFNVTTQQVLYSPAQKAFVRAARASWDAGKMQSEDQRQGLIQDAVLTYIELNKWSQELDLLNTELANNRKMEDVEQQRVKEGVDRPAEYDKARLATARVRVRIAEASGFADVMRVHLAQLTGLSPAELATEPDSIPQLPELSQESDLASKAVATSPAVKVAEQQATAKRFSAEGEAKAARLPSVDIAAQYGLLSNFNNYKTYIRNFQSHNATGGLVFRFPFLDTAQRARAAEAKADAIRSARDAEEAKNKVSLETLRLQRTVQELAAAVDVSQLEYNLAQSELESTQSRIKAETGTLREEQDARTRVEQTYNALIDATLALDKARIQLLHNTGELEQWARSGR